MDLTVRACRVGEWYLEMFLQCMLAEVLLKPNPNRPDIAWVSFDPQERKSHNNAALVMDHLWARADC